MQVCLRMKPGESGGRLCLLIVLGVMDHLRIVFTPIEISRSMHSYGSIFFLLGFSKSYSHGHIEAGWNET